MKFNTAKKRFVQDLKAPEAEPASATVLFEDKTFPLESSVTVDPEGDAWIFLGQHTGLSKFCRQDDNDLQTSGSGKRKKKQTTVTT
jgi:hypothetical protein